VAVIIEELYSDEDNGPVDVDSFLSENITIF